MSTIEASGDVLVDSAAETANEWTPGLIIFTAVMGVGALSLGYMVIAGIVSLFRK